jgi:hypothetical protein
VPIEEEEEIHQSLRLLKLFVCFIFCIKEKMENICAEK